MRPPYGPTTQLDDGGSNWLIEDSAAATISLFTAAGLAVIAVAAVGCAIQQKMKRSHGSGRRSSHEELYTNVNAGRGGYEPTTSTQPKPAMKKKQSEMGAALAPSSPTFVREKEAGGMQSTKLNDVFFDDGGGSPGSKKAPKLKKQPSSGSSMKSAKLDDAFFAGSSDHSLQHGLSTDSLGNPNSSKLPPAI